MRLLFPQRLLVLIITFGLLLAACGQATSQPSTSAPMASAPTSVTTAPSSAPTVALLDGIPQGQMPQGYHTLGADSAPVTLVNYSDFL